MKVPSALRSAFATSQLHFGEKISETWNHRNAAHMLMRVADNISKFPAHTVSRE